jgi:hypothetical protein
VDPANDRLQAKFHFSHFGGLRSSVYFRVVAVLVFLAGCSERGLTINPSENPSSPIRPVGSIPTAGDAGVPGTDPTAEPLSVFVTGETFTGNLGGLDGADEKCQHAATLAGLYGTYRAWVSDSNGSPSTRFTYPNRNYALVNGALVAKDWADLTSGFLRHAIDLTEVGAFVATEQCTVWTDTDENGTLHDAHQECDGWSAVSTALGPISGNVGSINHWSTGCSGGSCAEMKRLYCFEQ